jgi:glycosyltransferase involved in cell wall biosynthesis
MINALKEYEWEAIIVNDGSSDDTEAILYDLQKSKDCLKVVSLASHYGRGRALRSGFEAATGDIIVTLDADLSYAPYHIEKLVNKLLDEDADVVVASAYRQNGSVKNVPFNRFLISRVGNKILSYMFGSQVTVLTCIVRSYKNGFIKNLDLHSADKEIHLEILSKAKIIGAKIVEIPADLCWRPTKLNKPDRTGSTVRRSTLKVKKTSFSHLFLALLNRPGVVFWVPGYILLAISILIFLITVWTIFGDFTIKTSIYHAVRNSMIRAPISWLTMAFSFLLGIQFFTLGFLTNQIKSNQEETYRTLHTIFKELKKKK